MSTEDRLLAFETGLGAPARRLAIAEYRRCSDLDLDIGPAREAHRDFVMSSFEVEDFRSLAVHADPEIRLRGRAAHRYWLRSAREAEGEIGRIGDAVEKAVYGHRGGLDGEELTLPALVGRLAEVSDEADRERLWSSYFRPQAALERDVRRLFELRDRRARSLGFDDAYALGLFVEDLDSVSLEAIFQGMERETSEAGFVVAGWMRRFGYREWAPWNFLHCRPLLAELDPDSDPASSASRGGVFGDTFDAAGMVQRCSAILTSAGFALDHIPIEPIAMPIGGIAHLIDVPDDIRITLNPDAGVGNHLRLLHELGHAAHFSSIEVANPLLQDESCGGLVEAYAQLLTLLIEEPSVQREILGLPAEIFRPWIRQRRERELFAQRICMASAMGEQALHREVRKGRRSSVGMGFAGELDAAWQREQKRLLGYQRLAPGEWVWDLMLTRYPVYYQSYVMADLVASALAEVFRRRWGTLADPRLAPTLRQAFFADGCLRPWYRKLEDFFERSGWKGEEVNDPEAPGARNAGGSPSRAHTVRKRLPAWLSEIVAYRNKGDTGYE